MNLVKNKMNLDRFKNTKVYKLCQENKFVLLSFFTAIGIMLLIMYCYSMVPFGDNTILRMDLYHQYGPLFAELYDRLTGDGGLIYSWQSGGGGSFLGNFFNYLSSPLSLLIILFGHINITDAIMFLIIMKTALSAATFTYYLKASTEFKKHNAITAGFGILYAFSGYFIAYYWNVMWLDGMVLLPLIVLGIEKIVNGKSPKLYIATLALVLFSTYYIGYMMCIFATLYAICYYFGKYELGEKEYTPELTDNRFVNAKNNFVAMRLPRAAGKFAMYSILAVGTVAVTLLPTFSILSSCSATSGSFPSELGTYFNTFDFLANHLASLEPTIRSSGDDVLPNIFCGVGTVMLAFLYLYVKSVPLREKITRLVLLVVLFLSFDLNMLNYVWHGFHFPNDLPYRFSFAYSFILLTVAFKALLKIREITGRDLLNIGIGMSAFIVLLDELESKNVTDETIIISLVFVVIYTAVLSLLNNRKFQASAVASLLFCCMFAEIAVANTNHYDIDQPKTAYTSDYKNFTLLKERIDEAEGNDYYRMELTNLRTRMDPCWYNYNGVSTFSSMAYEKSANLHFNLGMFGNYINSYTYNLQTPIYNAMFALKYIVNNSEEISLNPNFYTAQFKAEPFTSYVNRYSLPIAYCVDSSVENWDTSFSSPFDVQSDYFEKATGVSGVYSEIPITGISYQNIQDFGDDFDTGMYVYYKETPGESASFTVSMVPEKTQNIYIYLTSDNVDQITVRNLDGNFSVTQDTSEEYILDIGEQKAGEEIFIDIPITDGDSGYIDLYAVGFNQELFEQGYAALNDNGAMKVSEFEDTKIAGTVTANEDCLLYTSINYDPSWAVYVDGERVSDDDIVKIGDALIGVKLQKGTHEITFKYTPSGMVEGAIISVICISLLVILLVVLPKRKETKKLSVSKAESELVPEQEIPLSKDIPVAEVEQVEKLEEDTAKSE